MAVAITHKFLSEKADSPDSTRVQPSNWNDTHDILMAGGAVLGRSAGVGQAPAVELPAGAVGIAILAASTSELALLAAGAAPTVHTHTIAQITSLQTSLNAKLAVPPGGGTVAGSAALLDRMTAAQYRSNTADKVVVTGDLADAMAEVTLADASTVAWNMSLGINFVLTLGGNRILGNPTNVVVGRQGRIRVVQSGAGNFTLAKSANHKTLGGMALAVATGVGAESYIYYDVVSATKILLSFSPLRWS